MVFFKQNTVTRMLFFIIASVFSTNLFAYCCAWTPFTNCGCCAICPVDDNLNIKNRINFNFDELDKTLENAGKLSESLNSYLDKIGNIQENLKKIDLDNFLDVDVLVSQGVSEYKNISQENYNFLVKNIKNEWFSDKETTNDYHAKQKGKRLSNIQKIIDLYSTGISMQANIEYLQKDIHPLQEELQLLAKKVANKNSNDQATLRDVQDLQNRLQNKWFKVLSYSSHLNNIALSQESTNQATNFVKASYPANDLPEPIPSESTNGPFMQCMEDCSQLLDQQKEAEELLKDIASVHNSRIQINLFESTLKSSIEVINRHKQLSAQLNAAEKIIINHLADMFLDSETAFIQIMQDIHTKNSPDDMIYDDTFFLNNGVSTPKSIEVGQAIWKKMKMLAKPLANTNPPAFPIEDYLGTLKPELKKCIQFIKGTCQQYLIEKIIQEKKSSHNNIIYPPNSAEIAIEIDVNFSDYLTEKEYDNFIDQLNKTTESTVKIPYYSLDASTYTSPEEYNLILKPTVISAYTKHLDLALIYLQEADKQEAYEWRYRYGSSAAHSINYIANLPDYNPNRYESIKPPPVWYQIKGPDGAWWKNVTSLKMSDNTKEFTVDSKTFANINSNTKAINGCENISPNIVGGAEQDLLKSDEYRDCAAHNNLPIIEKYTDLTFDDSNFNSLEAKTSYALNNPDHLEFSLLKRLAELAMNIELSINEKLAILTNCGNSPDKIDSVLCESSAKVCLCDLDQAQQRSEGLRNKIQLILTDYTSLAINGDVLSFLDNTSFKEISNYLVYPQDSIILDNIPNENKPKPNPKPKPKPKLKPIPKDNKIKLKDKN